MMMDEDVEGVHQIAEEIARFRKEFWDTVLGDMTDEMNEIANTFDPAKGSGRGPGEWADGD